VDKLALVALPPDKVSALPKFTPFVVSCTVPLGVPVEDGEVSLTVAVNVTATPEQAGFADEGTTVDELALVTVSVPMA